MTAKRLRMISVGAALMLFAAGCSSQPLKVREAEMPVAGDPTVERTTEPTAESPLEPTAEPTVELPSEEPTREYPLLTDPPDATPLYWGYLQSNMCYNWSSFADPEGVGDVMVFPCTEPHELQMLGMVPVPGPWPGEEKSRRIVSDGCLELWTEIDARTPGMDWGYYPTAPSQVAFDAGIDYGLCSLATTGPPLTQPYY